MVNYKCITCNKNFDKKYNYDVHINRKFKCKAKEKNKKEDLDSIEEKLRKEFDDKLEAQQIENNNINKALTNIISEMKIEQKNLSRRLNTIEILITKNTNTTPDLVIEDLQNGGAIEGLQFENQLSKELKKYNMNVYFDKEITKKYGKICAVVDIVIKKDGNLVTLQCKREIKAGTLKDVNHFIRGSQIIEKKENIKPKLYWISKIAPNKAGLESLKNDNITIITDINSNNAINKCINEIKKDMNIKDKINLK